VAPRTTPLAPRKSVPRRPQALTDSGSMAPICIVVVALALVAQVNSNAVEGNSASVGDACMCEGGANGTFATSMANTTTTSSTTAAPNTTTAAAAGNASNSSRRLDALEFDDELFDDEVFGTPARQLDDNLECVCPTTTTTTASASTTTLPADAIIKKVVQGELAIDFGSARRLVANDFLANARKLLEAVDVQPHIEAGLKNSTGQSSAKVTACVKQGATDVFNTKYEIELESGSNATAVTTKLANIAKAGADFDAFKAAVSASASAVGANLTIAAPPTVLSAPAVTTGSITNTTTPPPNALVDAACPHGALSAMALGLAAFLAFSQ